MRTWWDQLCSESRRNTTGQWHRQRARTRSQSRYRRCCRKKNRAWTTRSTNPSMPKDLWAGLRIESWLRKWLLLIIKFVDSWFVMMKMQIFYPICCCSHLFLFLYHLILTENFYLLILLSLRLFILFIDFIYWLFINGLTELSVFSIGNLGFITFTPIAKL